MIHMIIILFAMSLTHLFCFFILSERKYSIKKTIVIYLLTAIAFVCSVMIKYIFFTNQFSNDLTYEYGITITICFFVFFFTSSDSAEKKIFLFISYSNIFCILLELANILVSISYHESMDIKLMYVRNIIRTVLTIPVVLLYYKYLRPTIRDIPVTKKKTWISLCVTSGLFLLVFSMFISNVYNYFQNKFMYKVLFLSFVAIYASVLWVVFDNIQQMNQENKMKLIAQKDKYLQIELNSAKQNEQIAKRIKHDYRHHIQSIASLLKNNDINHALQYIEHYTKSLNVIQSLEFCPNVTVNAILTSFYNITKYNGISFHASADTPANSVISDMDFVVILSNLLENAVNECIELDNKCYIKINIRTIENKTVIVCSNSCRNNIEIVNNMIKNKGVGIDSIISSIKKYNGDINYTNNNDVLTVCVILK